MWTDVLSDDSSWKKWRANSKERKQEHTTRDGHSTSEVRPQEQEHDNFSKNSHPVIADASGSASATTATLGGDECGQATLGQEATSSFSIPAGLPVQSRMNNLDHSSNMTADQGNKSQPSCRDTSMASPATPTLGSSGKQPKNYTRDHQNVGANGAEENPTLRQAGYSE
ncbi:unnamed protein product, partial [Amoebophrya sp. A120]|eukprot:GSA120T00026188001.1